MTASPQLSKRQFTASFCKWITTPTVIFAEEKGDNLIKQLLRRDYCVTNLIKQLLRRDYCVTNLLIYYLCSLQYVWIRLYSIIIYIIIIYIIIIYIIIIITTIIIILRCNTYNQTTLGPTLYNWLGSRIQQNIVHLCTTLRMSGASGCTLR